MGCSAADVCPATWNGENRDWGLDDPHGEAATVVREIQTRVEALFDELYTERRTAN